MHTSFQSPIFQALNVYAMRIVRAFHSGRLRSLWCVIHNESVVITTADDRNQLWKYSRKRVDDPVMSLECTRPLQITESRRVISV